jgi:hypothetical protein
LALRTVSPGNRKTRRKLPAVNGMLNRMRGPRVFNKYTTGWMWESERVFMCSATIARLHIYGLRIHRARE